MLLAAQTDLTLSVCGTQNFNLMLTECGEREREREDR